MYALGHMQILLQIFVLHNKLIQFEIQWFTHMIYNIPLLNFYNVSFHLWEIGFNNKLNSLEYKLHFI